jgi:uncharacterized protein DUF481
MPARLWLPFGAALGLCLALGTPHAVLAQDNPSPPRPAEALTVFLDCHGPCDFDYIRREITYVNWVRDRQDADVHLLLTTQGTGGGGQQYTLKFIGLRTFQGSDDEFVFNSQQSDTFDEVRALIAQRIGLGLARFAARGPQAGRLRLTFEKPEEGDAPLGQPARDPWNLWVFTLSANGQFSSESQQSSNRVSGSLRARRVTEKWKLSARIQGNRSTSRFELDSGEVVHSKRSDYTLSLLGVRSLGEHWSFGVNAGGRRSSRDNYDLLTRIAPGIEYDVFPYKESSRRQFVLVYEVALAHAKYHEETIFSKLRETRVSQALTAAVEAVQPWGGVEARLTGSNYLDHWSQNRVILEAGLNLRIVRGLNLNLNAFYARVRDQLSLAKEGASDDEVLLQLKQLKTSYTFEAFIGLNYTFGSKFNNVVNPRFDSSIFDF